MAKINSMRKIITLCMMALPFFAFSQNAGQFSIEGGYGASIPVNRFSDYSHFEVGFRYMVDETWGVKFDYGSDTFRKEDIPQYGSDYMRISVQAVHNLARTFNLKQHSDSRVNLLAHAGLGYSNMKSQRYNGTDNIGHVIIGITPQVKITNYLALYLDSSYIMNFSQNYDFNGSRNNETGKLLNISAGLVFYLGKNAGDVDWR